MTRGPTLDRRSVLAGAASGAAASIAGCSILGRGGDATVTEVDPDRALELAERFAPTLYFDSRERWFPTDPRPYESQRDGRTVVDGFDAFEGYVRAGGHENPPEPRVFYHAVRYADSPLAVVQFWFYSVFDQFATNFHWHDWEVLHVFVDTDTDDPQLYVASSHSRSVPNNEFLDPDPDRRPRVLSELGSHSSGLSINEDEEHFQRVPLDGDTADITNSVIDGIEDIASIPLAYGLPRDEGFALPFAVPELDGAPVYDHERLPSVTASDLVPDALTIGSFADLGSPPEGLPTRGTGRHFEYEGRNDPDADATYDLAPTADLEHIEEFTGPQLSFQFAIPEFAEDLVADHITTTNTPWTDPRYEAPANDISETTHRQALADRYDAIGDPSPANQVLAAVTNAVPTEDAPDGEGLTTVQSPLESFALLQSEGRAVPTFNGIAAVQNVPEGEHRLTINGAGVAPHSETVGVGEGTAVAGVRGEIPLVARESASKLEVDPGDSGDDLTDFAVEDDFAGRLYDAPLSGADAVYVHRGGAFTAEVRDAADELGAFRVNPGRGQRRTRIESPATGKTPLANYLVDLAEETLAAVVAARQESESGDDDDQDDGTGSGQGGGTDAGSDQGGGGDSDGNGGPLRGLEQALEAVVEAASRAAERAEAGDRGNADAQLQAVATRLSRVRTRLSEARGALPEVLANATEKRLEQAERRTDQARDAEKL